MTIALVIYLIFLLIYLIFNAYAISRIWAMRFAHDATKKAIFVYLAMVIAIVALTFILVFSFYSISFR
jgi:hypothetical protein